MRVAAVLLLSALICAAPAFAKPLTEETAHEYLVLLGVEKNLKATTDAIMTPILNGMLKGLANEMTRQGLPQQKIKAAVEAMTPHVMAVRDDLLENLDTLMPMRELEEQVYLPVLRESFNDEELAEINAFLKTPTGEKFVNESMVIFQKSSQKVQVVFGPEIERFLNEGLEERREQAIKDVQAAVGEAEPQ